MWKYIWGFCERSCYQNNDIHLYNIILSGRSNKSASYCGWIEMCSVALLFNGHTKMHWWEQSTLTVGKAAGKRSWSERALILYFLSFPPYFLLFPPFFPLSPNNKLLKGDFTVRTKILFSTCRPTEHCILLRVWRDGTLVRKRHF